MSRLFSPGKRLWIALRQALSHLLMLPLVDGDAPFAAERPRRS